MLKELIERGYLPKEVPPLFTSITMGNVIGKTLPAAFTQPKATWTDPVQHDMARPGALRRRLTIPNPVNYFRLSNAFEQHKQILAAEWAKSPYSKTTPDYQCQGPRALAREVPDRSAARIEARAYSRYLLKTDIAQFYPSIYTHSIAWVLHTKPIAKANIKNFALAGNVLDAEFQACQSGQTKGIAIGPDTSLGIAELLLSPLDADLSAQCSINGGCRFIDDYELTFDNLSDADRSLSRFEALLSELGLQPNAAKTNLEPLPTGIESDFVSTLRSRVPDQGRITQDGPIFLIFAFVPRAMIRRRASSGMRSRHYEEHKSQLPAG